MAHKQDRPSLKDLLALEIPYAVKISPLGSKLACQVRQTDWKENRYVFYIIVVDLESGKTARLTRHGTAQQMAWSGETDLLVLVEGPDGKSQVHLFEGLIGEGWPVTEHQGGVQRFWPFAGGVLYLAADPTRGEKHPRKERFGDFKRFEGEESAAGLYYLSFSALRKYEAAVRASTGKEAKNLARPEIQVSRLLPEPIHIENVVPGPDGRHLYLNCRRRDDLVYFRDTAAYRIDLDPEAAVIEHLERETLKRNSKIEEQPKDEAYTYLGAIRQLTLPKAARIVALSPDGSQLLANYSGPEARMYQRDDLWRIEASAMEKEALQMHNLSAPLDRAMGGAVWTEAGIYTRYIDGTQMKLARLSDSEDPFVLDLGDLSPYFLFDQFDVSDSGRLAFVGANNEAFPDIYVGDLDGGGRLEPKKMTAFGEQVSGWELGSREVVRWPSRDGVEIEGVLYKPADFDPNNRYPMVFVVHGGPRSFSGAFLLSTEDWGYYPSIQFLQKDVLVLKPNYRGSQGRGQEFLSLNVDNLGVGDLWDLESAIDYLDERGWIDPQKVGCMGWSQGGYISAFAGLHSDRFAAVSVGAGISDWYTYHISNDIPQFTTDYLSASPFRDREIYRQTAPISNLDRASTPALIQHGTEDRRVPVSNAYELYRGLKEMGVPVELFLYPGMAHPITKPRQNHAVLYQNLNWFGHYLLGEELDLLGDGEKRRKKGEKKDGII